MTTLERTRAVPIPSSPPELVLPSPSQRRGDRVPRRVQGTRSDAGRRPTGTPTVHRPQRCCRCHPECQGQGPGQPRWTPHAPRHRTVGSGGCRSPDTAAPRDPGSPSAVAAAASVAAALWARRAVGLLPSYLTGIGTRLAPGRAAGCFLVSHGHLAHVLEEVRRFDGWLIHSTLPEAVHADLVEALSSH